MKDFWNGFEDKMSKEAGVLGFLGTQGKRLLSSAGGHGTKLVGGAVNKMGPAAPMGKRFSDMGTVLKQTGGGLSGSMKKNVISVPAKTPGIGKTLALGAGVGGLAGGAAGYYAGNNAQQAQPQQY